MPTTNKFFAVCSYRVIVEEDFVNGNHSEPQATVRVLIAKNGEFVDNVYTVDEGNGPVNALDKALRKALIGHYPEIAKVKLVDYEVHTIKRACGTGSKVRVTITSSDGKKKWVTEGISDNVIKASLTAIADSLEKELSSLYLSV